MQPASGRQSVIRGPPSLLEACSIAAQWQAVWIVDALSSRVGPWDLASCCWHTVLVAGRSGICMLDRPLPQEAASPAASPASSLPCIPSIMHPDLQAMVRHGHSLLKQSWPDQGCRLQGTRYRTIIMSRLALGTPCQSPTKPPSPGCCLHLQHQAQRILGSSAAMPKSPNSIPCTKPAGHCTSLLKGSPRS